MLSMISLLLNLLMCILQFIVVCLGECSRLSWRRTCGLLLWIDCSIRVSWVTWTDSATQVNFVFADFSLLVYYLLKEGVSKSLTRIVDLLSFLFYQFSTHTFNALLFVLTSWRLLCLIGELFHLSGHIMIQCHSSSLRFSSL